MTAKEQGFLLMTSPLGDPDRKVLSPAQFRVLARRVREGLRPREDRSLTEADLIGLGYAPEQARQILDLLSGQDLLEHYLRRGHRQGCVPLTRISEDYPMAVHNRLRDDAPGSVWAKGDLALLRLPAISLAGSRDIRPSNRAFAWEVGRQAALQGLVLVSGNARGADQAAQQGCLDAGGQVIAVVADRLDQQKPDRNILYLSEDGFDLPFSAQRALSRNRLIHCMGLRTFIAQCGYQHGGTWDGTAKNLRHGWSPVYCYDDGSPAVQVLTDMGASPVDLQALADFSSLPLPFRGLFDT